ncbi:MAG TPA: hypothetical protein VNV18_13845 [Stellaceae bacterium]|jgi:hypothetical protein|nr:hypothetical protein [Stellaceae bacterium]
MTACPPTLLRWTEEAEAEEVCALALLQREPQSGAVRALEAAAATRSSGGAPALWPRLLGWFTYSSP